MSYFLNKLRRFLKDESGPTAVEYAVMIMLIFLAVIVMVQTIGRALDDSFSGTSQSIDDAFGAGS
jgi:pilus assembly protein Flp/PilA